MNVADLNVWFFGCWNQAGHYWHIPGGRHHDYEQEPYIRWIDGGYAPRRIKHSQKRAIGLVKDPRLCWAVEASTDDDRRCSTYDSDELAQGLYLVHRVDAPISARGVATPLRHWTIMSWWDRCQGDTRGACNSTLVVEDVPVPLATAEMRFVLEHAFPHVIANLTKHGVTLAEATP